MLNNENTCFGLVPIFDADVLKLDCRRSCITRCYLYRDLLKFETVCEKISNIKNCILVDIESRTMFQYNYRLPWLFGTLTNE